MASPVLALARPLHVAEGARVLHITYDGLLEPLGWGQVARYAQRLAGRHTVHILSWEKPADLADAARVREAEARLAEAGVCWHRLAYHRHPALASKAYDIARGYALARRIVRREGIRIIHARSYVPAAMALRLKRREGTRFLFDMRGLWADDRVETGQMRAGGAVYRAVKRLERDFFAEADAVVSLTHAGAEALRAQLGELDEERIVAIPTCVDTDLFRPQPERRRGAGQDLRVGYVGSAGAHYRFDQVSRFFGLVRGVEPRARLVVLNRGQHALVARSMADAGVPAKAWSLEAVPPDAVAATMATLDVGLFFIDPTPSKLFSAPTRVAEFLSSGVPLVTNRGVGDVDRIVAQHDVGILLPDFSSPALERAARALPAFLGDPSLQERARQAAERWFSLDEGVRRYDRLYHALAA